MGVSVGHLSGHLCGLLSGRLGGHLCGHLSASSAESFVSLFVCRLLGQARHYSGRRMRGDGEDTLTALHVWANMCSFVGLHFPIMRARAKGGA